MITKIRLRDVRCFRDVEVELGPLTAFVGANASGKSTLLECLDPRRQLSKRDVRQRAASRAHVEIWFADGGHQHRQSHVTTTPPDAAPTVQSLHLDPKQLRQANQVTSAWLLQGDGSNLTNVFYTLGRREQQALAGELAELVPVYSDVDTEPTSGGNHQLRFYDRWSRDTTYQPPEVSDGTMLVLAYLLLRHQVRAPDVITIEEPERGLHPYLIQELIEFLRKLATGELPGKPVQVVMSTHSPEVLDALRPGEVRFLSRDPDDGAVSVVTPPTTTPEWEEAYRAYHESLGSLWMSGGLGGVPVR